MGIFGNSRRSHSPVREPRATSAPEPPTPPLGAYLTDGCCLYRVTQTIRNKRPGERYVALEDCKTLDVVLCPAHALSEQRLRAVMPRERA